VGVGWVSIVDPHELRAILGIPEGIVPIAYLCLGRVPEFGPEPELQALGWQGRIDLAPLVYLDRWGRPAELGG